MDRKSRFILGYVIRMRDPNSDTVLDSFVDAVKKCGIPDRVQIDNGHDYTVFDLFNEDNLNSLVNTLGVDVRHSNPYNAKAKPIERFFGSLEEYNKMLSSYIGGSPDRRPESMNGTNKQLSDKKKVMFWEDFLHLEEAFINRYNQSPHTGKGMEGMTPASCYKKCFKGCMRVLSETEMKILFRRQTSTVKVSKNGVKFRQLGNFQYTSTELIQYHWGERVYARYYTNDTKDIHIYNEAGQFLCIASSPTLYAYSAGHEANVQCIRDNNAMKRELRKHAKSIETINDTSTTIEDVFKRRSDAFGVPLLSDIPTEYHLDESKQHEVKQIEAAEAENCAPAPGTQRTDRALELCNLFEDTQEGVG